MPRVRVIGADGEQAGIFSRDDALDMAQEAELDLVEIQPHGDPPVCRIMDYGKFKFEQQKKANAARKKTKQVEIKEVKFRPVTEEGDYKIKMRNVVKFLEAGNKVKITIRFRVREMRHQEIGRELAARIREEVAEMELGVVEQMPRQEGRQMHMMIGPPKKN